MKSALYLATFVLTFVSPLIAIAQEVKTGCGDYVLPVFPAAADKAYKKTCWVARAQKDEFTDVSSCQIYPAGTDHDAYPFVYVRKGSISVSVAGGDQYPGSTSMIRVDDREAVSGGSRFNKAASELLIKQMSGGSVIKARFSEWPTDTYRTGTVDSAGFSEAVEYCRASVQ
jgi:hypothetical protein